MILPVSFNEIFLRTFKQYTYVVYSLSFNKVITGSVLVHKIPMMRPILLLCGK